jgi:hypothetical protein
MEMLDQLLNAVIDAARADALGLTYFGCHCVDCGVNTAPAIWRGEASRACSPSVVGVLLGQRQGMGRGRHGRA